MSREDLLRIVQQEPWMESASCKGMDANLFHPRSKSTVPPEVKQVCAVCPVRAECLDYGSRFDTARREGIYGGVAPRYRQGRRLSVTLKPIDHGTANGYHAERRRGVPVCPACRSAYAVYSATYKQSKAS